MFGLGLPELILILVIALIFVGPGKLPGVGAAIGKAIAEFRKSVSTPKEASGNVKYDEKTTEQDIK